MINVRNGFSFALGLACFGGDSLFVYSASIGELGFIARRSLSLCGLAVAGGDVHRFRGDVFSPYGGILFW